MPEKKTSRPRHGKALGICSKCQKEFKLKSNRRRADKIYKHVICRDCSESLKVKNTKKESAE